MNGSAVIVTAGIGLSRRAVAGDVTSMLRDLARAAGVGTFDAVGTIDRRLHLTALSKGVGDFAPIPIVAFSAAELDDISVPHPSRAVKDAIGTPSVAEAAAVRAALHFAEAAANLAGRPETRSPLRTSTSVCVHLEVPKIIRHLVTGAVAIAKRTPE